jgi:hypothetical protein
MSVRRMCMRISGASALAVMLAASGPRVVAQAAAQQPDLRVEGDWVRTDPEGSGSFDGLGAQFPKAELLPGVQMAGGGGRGGRGGPGGAPGAGGGRGNPRPENAGPLRPGEAVVINAMPCGGRGGFGNNVGSGLINPDSGGVHIVEGKNEVRFSGERGGWRFIYLDGRKHPDPGVPSGAGHSVGHYEGNVLVVETVGFTAGAVPGSGMRTPETKLTERFEVQPDGKSMKITYTWEDPKVYAKPHTYRLIFDRAPRIGGYSYSLEEWCDASDPGEGQSITAPKQL